MKATITSVNDWNEWCWDVLLDFGNSALAMQFPRQHKPGLGDLVEWPKKNKVIWKGIEITVDQRPMIARKNGDVNLG